MLLLFFEAPAYAAVELTGFNFSVFKYIVIICVVIVIMGFANSRFKK
jgi:hypothetical protein